MHLPWDIELFCCGSVFTAPSQIAELKNYDKMYWYGEASL